MASLEEALCTHSKKQWPHLTGRSFMYGPTERSNGLTGSSFMDPLKEAMASPEEALQYVPTERSNGLTGSSFMYPLEEAMASPEEALEIQQTHL
jgi:hypothetical protein